MAETTLPKLSVSREVANQKIQAQIKKGLTVQNRMIASFDDLHSAVRDAQNWSNYNDNLLRKFFGTAVMLGYVRFDIQHFNDFYDPILDDEIAAYRRKMEDGIGSLEAICDSLELYDDPSKSLPHDVGDEIFIVHGRDDEAKETVARFVEKLGLKATILHEKPSSSLTIIEKIEKYSGSAGFAIVLLTPDDIGALKDSPDDERNPRARQNVVFELGYFMGKLGRKRVCPLFKDELERPSDVDGIVYVPMDGSNGWQLKLAREMKQAGLPIDLNKLA